MVPIAPIWVFQGELKYSIIRTKLQAGENPQLSRVTISSASAVILRGYVKEKRKRKEKRRGQGEEREKRNHPPQFGWSIQEGLYDRSLESDVIVKKSRMSFTPTSFEEAVTQFRKCFDKHRKYLAITLLNRFANLIGKPPLFLTKSQNCLGLDGPPRFILFLRSEVFRLSIISSTSNSPLKADIKA